MPERINSGRRGRQVYRPRLTLRSHQHVAGQSINKDPGGQKRLLKKEVQTEIWPEAAPLQDAIENWKEIIVLSVVKGKKNEDEPDAQNAGIGNAHGFDAGNAAITRQQEQMSDREGHEDVKSGLPKGRQFISCHPPVSLVEMGRELEDQHELDRTKDRKQGCNSGPRAPTVWECVRHAVA